MSAPPQSPKIYHITHVENLSSILACGCIWSEAQMLGQGLGGTTVGISEIKRRRMVELAVPCHPGTMVGAYVPFYLCPRSIMLYLLHRGNHPGLTYTGGQQPIVHLEADLNAVVRWADTQERPWAFTTRNAGAYYVDFYHALDDLRQVDWTAVRATDFRDATIKEHKQAEFLVLDSFPWVLVERIGVLDVGMQRHVSGILEAAKHRPDLVVRPAWYY